MSDTAEKKHSSLPWTFNSTTRKGGVSRNYWLFSGEGAYINRGAINHAADAEFIVRACNHHDELVAVLRAICEDGIPLHGDDAGTESVGSDLLEAARAVLAKVK